MSKVSKRSGGRPNGRATTSEPSGTDYPYKTHLHVHFAHLERILVQPLVDRCTDQWYKQTLCQVNGSVLRLGVVQGKYHWHKHDDNNEFFFALGGALHVDIEGRTFTLDPREGMVVPKGVVHRTRAPERTSILMIEDAGVVPTGD